MGAMSPSWTLEISVSPELEEGTFFKMLGILLLLVLVSYKLKNVRPESGPSRRRDVVAFSHNQPMTPP